MLTVDELWTLIDCKVSALPIVDVPLDQALGRRLGEDILADEDMPAFTRSAIDGYLLPSDAPPGRYRIVGEIKPGAPASPSPAAGEALKIFTGSALSEGGLVMIEDSLVDGDAVVTSVPASDKHVRRRASQASRGDRLLPAGTVVTPGTLALAATVGQVRLKASPQVRVAHLVTGSEIVPASEKPGPGFIRDSNSILIASLLAQSGARRVSHALVSEEVAQGVNTLQSVDADLFLISGGASVGEHDGTTEILHRLGFTIHSEKVKSRPGKPLIFATRESQIAFGLPGNPLSHFVCFHLFVRRVIDLLSGFVPAGLSMVRVEGDPLPADPRETWWPAQVHTRGFELCARPLRWKDSSDLTGLPSANALLRISSQGGNGLVPALIFDKVLA